MKKFILIIVISVISSNMFISCDSTLELVPEDAISKEGFFKTPADFSLAVSGLYSKLRSNNIDETNGSYGGDLYWGVCADELYFQFSWHNPWFDISRGSMNVNTNNVGFIWSHSYSTINWANTIIEQTEANKDLIDVGLYENTIGQAHFIRAITYLRLTSLYGAVPLVDRLLTPTESKLPRTSVEEITRSLIIPDLDIAIQMLGETPFEGNIGMATKKSALGMKVRALLYIEDYEGTVSAAEDLMLGYDGFVDDFESIFEPNNENNNEILFSIKYISGGLKEGGTFSTPFGPSHIPGKSGINGSWRSSAVLPELIQSFPLTDGLSFDQSPLYDEDDPWANRGARFEHTFYIGGHSVVRGAPFEPWMVGSFNSDYVNAYPFNVDKGFIPEETGFDWTNEDDSDFIVLRFTDVLLMYAEAKTELNQIDASVYDIMDKIRDRAGIARIPSGLSQPEMREAIRLERKLELAFEGVRYFDIRRWGIAEDVFNSISSDEDFNFGSTKLFLPEHNLWPVPQAAIDANENLLPNNPGY